MIDRGRATRARSDRDARGTRLAVMMLVGAALPIAVPAVVTAVGVSPAPAEYRAAETSMRMTERPPALATARPVLPAAAERALQAPGAGPTTPASAAQDAEEISRSPLYLWLDRHRNAAYWAAPLLMVAVAILPIPAEIPAAMNGMLFGAVLGVLITWGGAMLGATISYELGRYFGAGLTRRFFKPETMAKVEALRETEAAVLLALRLTPVVAFTLVNWACGLLRVRRSTFLWTTAVGILPGAIAFTISGSAIAMLYRRYPGTVTAAALLFLAVILARIWWKQRRAASPTVC